MCATNPTTTSCPSGHAFDTLIDPLEPPVKSTPSKRSDQYTVWASDALSAIHKRPNDAIASLHLRVAAVVVLVTVPNVRKPVALS